MKRVLLYGVGKQAEYLLNHHMFTNETVIGGVETRAQKEKWKEYRVYSIDSLSDVDYDEIWLVNRYIDTLDNCVSFGVEKEKIVICNKCIWDSLCKRNTIVDYKYLKNEAEEYEGYILRSKSREVKVFTNALSIAGQTVDYADYSSLFGGTVIAEDYFRFATLKLLADEIKSKSVEGVCAELGVYKGKFAKCINREFPDKELYLFDTFEGFPENDMAFEEQSGFTEKKYVSDYSDTSAEEVMQEMIYPEKCIIRKGYFPDTIPEEELRYAFVSIRASLYKPVLEGLRYFYPRLSPGGYIMVGVYNSPFIWKGVKEAVREYEEEMHFVKVPLADAQGCLVIGK